MIGSTARAQLVNWAAEGSCALTGSRTRKVCSHFFRASLLTSIPEPQPEIKSREQQAESPDTRKGTLPRSGPQTLPQIEWRPQSQEPVTQEQVDLRMPAVAGNGASYKKRKRESLQWTPAWRQYVSPYLPATPSGSIHPSSNGSTPATQTTHQTKSPQSSYPYKELPPQVATAPVNYVYRKETSPASITPREAVSKANNGTGLDLKTSLSLVDRLDPDVAYRGYARRETSTSLSPSTQLLQSFRSPPAEEPAEAQPSAVASARSRPVDPPDPPLIDTLPRKKQKQIYSIIGGLQSGIRSCRQQAGDMQRQLDLLQAALGIDTEDDNDGSLFK